MGITVYHYLGLSLILFSLGVVGVLVRKNIIIVLMSVELMLNAANINFIAFSQYLNDITGHIFSVFVICVAAGEVAIGLAVVVLLYRKRNSVDVSVFDLMKW